MSNSDRAMGENSLVEMPSLGRRLLVWVSALGLLTLLGVGGYLLLLWEPQQLPIRVVTVDGEVKRLKPQRLQQTVIDHLSGGILTQDLAELKAAVEAMPWVRSASLRRHWPDRLELAVVEEVALARWGDDALVSADGVVFRPEAGTLPRGLPRLSGREEDALQLVERLQGWGSRLLDLDMRIEELTLDARGAWSLHLSGGLTLLLGKAHADGRLSRFLRAYPTLAASGMPSLIDMRYSNGLALRWADSPGDGQGAGGGKAAHAAKLKSRAFGSTRS